MMLPSGNDAAVALALYFGQALIMNDSSLKINNPSNEMCYMRFVKEMNMFAKS